MSKIHVITNTDDRPVVIISHDASQITFVEQVDFGDQGIDLGDDEVAEHDLDDILNDGEDPTSKESRIDIKAYILSLAD